jgi:3-deoxy-D-manno-octulosonic-acid transferase
LVVLIAASPWLLWSAIRKGKYRQGFAAKFFGGAPALGSPISPRIWFHAVSVGEVNLIAPLLGEIAAKHSGCECVISTTTAAGYALAKMKYPTLTVFYAPLDFNWAVHRAMQRIRPTMLVLVELELWPNLIRAAKEHGAKVAIINGRLSQHSFRGYWRLRFLFRRTLKRVDLIAAQNDEYAARFRALGAPTDRVFVTGSLKFDGARTNRSNEATRRLRALAGFTDDDAIFLAGSTQAPEEEIALHTFKSLKDEHPRLKLAIVPRHPHRFDEVAALLDGSGLAWQRRSSFAETPHSAFPIPHSPCRVLLVDTIGELSAWWGAAMIGFVGGSLGSRGGQNMIEPAAYGVATCFGPNTRNFRDVVELMLTHDAAVVVSDAEQLTAFVRRCLESPNYARILATRAQTVVQAQLGATVATVQLLDLDGSSTKIAVKAA